MYRGSLWSELLGSELEMLTTFGGPKGTSAVPLECVAAAPTVARLLHACHVFVQLLGSSCYSLPGCLHPRLAYDTSELMKS